VFGEADEIAGGAVDQDVDVTEIADDSRHHRVDGLGIADVGGVGDGPYAALPQFRSGRLGMLDLPAGDGDIAAVRRKRVRDAAADPRAAARDERDAAFQEISGEHVSDDTGNWRGNEEDG